MRRLGYVPALDGLRGIAIAAVIGEHFFALRGGFYGVDLFFVLSGFLITTLLLEENDRGRIHLRGFYERRARRLLPALVAFLVVAALFGARKYGVAHLSVLISASLFYVGNLACFFRGDLMAGTPFGHLWSLAQEEQFYLVWPLLLIQLLRRFGERALLAVLAAAFVCLVAYTGALGAAGAGWHRLNFAPDTHASGLVLGCAAALIRRRGSSVRGGAAALALFVAAAALGAQTVAWSTVGLPVVEVACAVMVLAASQPGSFARALSLRPLVYLGAISYSLYVWHYLIRWIYPNPGLGGIFPAFVSLVLTALVQVRRAAFQAPACRRGARRASAGGRSRRVGPGYEPW